MWKRNDPLSPSGQAETKTPLPATRTAPTNRPAPAQPLPQTEPVASEVSVVR